MTRKEFKKEMGEYWSEVKESAAKKEQEMRDSMPKMPEFQTPQMPTFEMPNMFGEGQWEQPQFQQFDSDGDKLSHKISNGIWFFRISNSSENFLKIFQD